MRTMDICDSVLERRKSALLLYLPWGRIWLTLYRAWPIGVTMVGIHERSAREKLHESDNKAHIMSDESTRKYLQSIKRCLSFAQVRWPPDDQLQLMG
jgi:Prp18 domain